MKEHSIQRRVRLTLIIGLLALIGGGAGAVQWIAQTSGPGLLLPGNSTDPNRFALYMPVPGGEKGEAVELAQQEADWNNRITYPTGRFNPAWVRAAAAQDARIRRDTPAKPGNSDSKGKPVDGPSAPAGMLALDPNGFTSLGPQPLRMTGCSGCYNYTTTAGRVNSIAIDPVTTNVAYIGTVGGGVWKTTNCCTSATSWSVVTDDPLLTTISIDDVTIDPNDHNTVYAGTGDLNYGSFSMGSQGILKSTDAGATWTVLGADVFAPGLPLPVDKFPQYQAVGKVRVDPRNSNNVVAGTKTGLYFSYDAGTNWAGPCTTNSFNTQRQDITGLILSDQGSSTRIIAAVGVRGFASAVQYDIDQNGANGLYKGSIPASGCPADFSLISTSANGWPAGTGAGARYINSTTGNQLGRIDIAIAPSNPDYIYAQVQSITPNTNSGCGSANGCQLGVWRSTNGGVTWTQLAGSPGASLRNCTNGAGDYPQNWYDQAIAVDPNNPDRVFISTFDIWFWANGATAFNDTSCGYSYSGSAGVVHVDQHALAFVPGSSSVLLAGNDGGVHMTANANIASQTVDPAWVNIDTGLNTIEFYSGDISGFFATSATQMANGGAQDNGSSTVKYTNGAPGPAQWQMGTGGDGFYARIDPVGGRFWQGGNSGGVTRCVAADCTLPGTAWSSARGNWTGDTQAFQLPYEIFKGTPGNTANDCKPTGCDHLIAGTTRVWETINGNAASVGSTWLMNSPANLTKQTLGNRSYINQLAYAPSISTTAIVGTNDGNVQYGFGLGRGIANSATWVNVTGGNAVLPNRPILDVTIDPSTPTTAYASVGGFNANTPSTPGHVFRVVCTANCASFTWSNKTGNLPDIPADSIIANPRFPQQVFVGTDFGLYFTNDITAAPPIWQRFQTGLPNVMIWDMQIDRGATTLSVWTRGRGAYVWPLPNTPFNKLNQTITFNPLPNKTYGDPDFTVSASASSGLTVSFSATGNCTVSGSTVHLTGAGSCTITAAQPGNSNYNPAADVPQSFSIALADQTITFPAISDKAYGDADFNPGATASSGLPVSYAASGSCAIVSGLVHITGVGSCTVTASQAGDSNYNPAEDVEQSFNIVKGDQTITFPAIANKTYGAADFAPGATASSGLPVSYAASGPCAIVSGQVHITGVGSCTVTASQAGDDNYNPAPDVDRTFSIARAVLTVTADNQTAQYSDPVALTASYTGFVYAETEAGLRGTGALSGNPSLTTPRTTSSPAGAYAITAALGSLSATNYSFAFTNGTFTVAQEDAAIQYTGETIAQIGTNLALRATVWDSAASGYAGANPESGAGTTLGDITKMWIRFDIYTAINCNSGTPAATRYAQVADTGVSGDGIGTASATFSSSAEGTFCVVARLVAGSSGGTNLYYTAPSGEAGAITFYENSGQMATGGGWINDPAGGKGNFGFNARYKNNGSPQGQLVYVYRGLYNGVAADYVIKSNALTALQFTGTAFPYLATLQGRCTIQINRASDGVQLYSEGNATFSATVKDTDLNPAAGNDTFALTVYDRNAVLYKSVPANTPLQGGNVVIHQR
jgi:hypothetical protein